MAEIVGAFCVPHIPLIAAQPGIAEKHQVDRVMDAFAHIRARITELNADTAIVIGDDHYTVFGPHCLPSILIGVGDVDGPYEDWLNHKRAPIANNTKLAEYIAEYGFENGFDWAIAKTLTVDHSVFVPYLKLVKDLPDLRMIPIYIMAGVMPLIKPKRCVQLGEMISKAVEAHEGSDRVVIVGTGGISHWVGMAEMGTVNEEFDRQILDMVEQRDFEGLTTLSDEHVLKTAGNGALEYRNWLVALGAVPHYDYDLICYEAISPWATGTAFVELKLVA